MKPYYEEISDTVLEIFEKDNEGGINNFEESWMLNFEGNVCVSEAKIMNDKPSNEVMNRRNQLRQIYLVLRELHTYERPQ